MTLSNDLDTYVNFSLNMLQYRHTKDSEVCEMGRRTIYLDLDDTYLDTEEYIRSMLSANGFNIGTASVYSDYIRGFASSLYKEILSDYSCIPKKVGADECLDIIKTEYDVVFLSCYTTNEEKIAKESFAKDCNTEIILCKDFDKSFVNMGNGIMFDDNPHHLIYSGLPSKNQFMMYNPYALDEDGMNDLRKFEGKIVLDWYDFTDSVMGVDEDAELREYICKRIQNCCEGYRV